MSDWRQVTIGELLTLEYGKPLPESARNGQGFPVYGSNGIVGFHSQALVKGPGVVVGRKGTGSSGTVTFSESDFSPIDTAFYVSIKDPAEMGMEFAYHLLVNAKLTELATQTGVPGLSRSRAYEARVTVPPLPVQKRIVEVIGAVDDQITALDAEAVALTAVLRRRRADLITDGSVQAVKAEYAFDFSTGVRRTPDRATGPYMTPYLRSANVGYGRLDLSDVLEMNYDPAERKKFGLQHGDVVVSEGSASANAVGMPAMWRDELPGPVCTQMTLLRLRAREGICIPEFVFHWCMWAYESRAFLDVAGGTNIKHISAKRAKGMAVRLPSVARQREMAVELDATTSALEAIRAEAAHLREVRARLLSGLLDRTIEI
ncbi:restriction endonuclease subunit S [Streptomyces sp. NPDC002935]|uniref:restriction endonuclease subunit S n=1 Tax=Streptomyces sp. NPDC002935 TaxID=3154545 RepID=UPI0033B067B2